MIINKLNSFLIIGILFFCKTAIAQNPIIQNQFSADPTARVFNGKVYVYPSHDIVAKPGQGRPNWFCMEDYHVFSSSDFSNWTDHGIVVSQYNVKWVDSTGYNMWAPDCIECNGKYYFYFPAGAKADAKKSFAIGVAVADKPEGPFVPQNEPIKGVAGIDPNVFIDKDGQAYLYWAMGKIFVAKLNANMLELASNPQEIKNLPEKGLKEGPFLFERNGIYYMTYPHVQNSIERLEYATSNNPMGPFTFAGIIMDESPMHCWTNHQSVVEYNKQWYLFYHQNALSPKNDKNRSICVDSLFFNADGSIQKVTPTHRGVGITNATQQIHIDRYSQLSAIGASVAFLDSTNTFKGWKTILNSKGAWAQYNAVDFQDGKLKNVSVRASSLKGSVLQIRLDKMDGPLVAEIEIPKSVEWKVISTEIKNSFSGVHNLIVIQKDNNPIEFDWLQFAN